MKNLKFLFLFLIGISLALSTSCKKDDDNDDNNNETSTETCYVMKMDYGNTYDAITYNPLNQVSNLKTYDSLDNATGDETVFSYSNDLLSIMEEYEDGDLTTKLDISYNANNKVDTVNVSVDTLGSMMEIGFFTFSFSGDQLSQVSMFFDVPMVGLTEVSKTEFTYSGNNVTQVKEYQIDMSLTLSLAATSTYTYDDKINPFLGIGLDYLRGDVQFLSENNIKSKTVVDNQGNTLNDESYNFTYEYSDKDYPTKQTKTSFDNSNTEVTNYEYTCE